MNLREKILNNKRSIAVFAILVALGIVGRLLPHPANFSPVGAIALFGGFYFRKHWRILVPMIIMFISDSVVGFYDLKIMFAVYLCLFVNSVLGTYIKKKRIMIQAASFSFLGAILFFIVTNFSVWFFASWYPHTLVGLINCYFLAIPFFFNSLLGDVFFSVLLFGVYALASNVVREDGLQTVNN